MFRPERLDDTEGWLVHADQLEAQGDPRGRLITLQHRARTRRATREDVRRYLFEHRAHLLGPLAERHQQWLAHWALGYIQRLDLVIEHHCRDAIAIIQHLDRTDGLWALEHLRLITSTLFDPALRALIASRPPRLRGLDVGPTNIGAGRVNLPVQTLLDAFPHLEHLRVELPADIKRLTHPRLQVLRVGGERSTFVDVDLSGLPALDTLELYSRDHLAPADVATLRGASVRRVVLHRDVAAAWLAVPGPAPAEIVLHGRAAGVLEAAQRTGAELKVGRDSNADRHAVLTPKRQRTARMFVRGDRFWRIRREDRTLVIRYGKLGQRGRTLRKDFAYAYAASRDYVERHGKKLEEGYREVFVPQDELHD